MADEDNKLTPEMLEEAVEKAAEKSGRSENLILSKDVIDAIRYGLTYNENIIYPKGCLVFDGEELFRVKEFSSRDHGNYNTTFVLDSENRPFRTVTRRAFEIRKVPEGSSLEAVRTLFGKPK